MPHQRAAPATVRAQRTPVRKRLPKSRATRGLPFGATAENAYKRWKKRACARVSANSRIPAVVWLFGKRQPTAGEREVRQTRRNRSGNQPQESRTSHLPCAAGHGDRSNPTNGETAVVTRILFRWPSGRNGSDACAARSPRVFWRTVGLRLSPVALVAATAGCSHIR